MKLALRYFLRNPKVSLTAALTAAVCTVFLLTFCGSIRTYQQELDESYAVLKATAHLTDSNAAVRVQLPEETYRAIL